jgi:triosephosphate isomerase (TIM)
MSRSPRQTVIAGNWKMYKTSATAKSYVDKLVPLVADAKPLVYLSVAFPLIPFLSQAAQGTNIVIGAQNMHDAEEGAFTGEVSSAMLNDAGAEFVILGHSERRHVFGETSLFVNQKVHRAIKEGLQPMVCIGETQQQREQGLTEKIVKEQLLESLDGITANQLETVIIAYEPVWAIGTGLTATPEQAQISHAFCRDVIRSAWGFEAADVLPILYGGSVKPDNVRHIMEQEDVDGVLVGGASLEADSFAQIVNYQTLKG